MTVYSLIATDKPAPKRATKAQRFCADCQHTTTRRTMLGLLTEHLCAAPTVAHPVTAQPVYACEQMRAQHAPCGPRARLYVARQQPAPDARLLTPARIRELFTRHMGRAVA